MGVVLGVEFGGDVGWGRVGVRGPRSLKYFELGLGYLFCFSGNPRYNYALIVDKQMRGTSAVEVVATHVTIYKVSLDGSSAMQAPYTIYRTPPPAIFYALFGDRPRSRYGKHGLNTL